MARGTQVTPRQNEIPAKREGLKLAQIASYDDLLTDALVDRVYFWTRIRKNRSRYFASRSIREDDVTNILRQSVIIDKNAAKACTQLLELPGLKSSFDKLSKDDQGHFHRHLRKYVDMYLPDCPFEVSTTNRYTIDTHEAATTARRPIRKGEVIKYLVGIQVPITSEDEKTYDISRQDFSIVMSSRKRTQSLFLGPARFANHDCDANARLTTRGPHSMTVVAARDIAVGQEITVSYGGDYFGIENCECLCATCEGFGRNGWDPTMVQDSTDHDEDEDDKDREKDSTRLSRFKNSSPRPGKRSNNVPVELQHRMHRCETAKSQVINSRKLLKARHALVKSASNSILQLQASRTSMVDHSLGLATEETPQAETDVLLSLEQERKELETHLDRLVSEMTSIEAELVSIKTDITALEGQDTPHTPPQKDKRHLTTMYATPHSLPKHPRLEELRNTPVKGLASSLGQKSQHDENTRSDVALPQASSCERSTSSSPSANRSQQNSRMSTPATSLSDIVIQDREDSNHRKSRSSAPLPDFKARTQGSAAVRLTRSSIMRSPQSFNSQSSKTATEDEGGHLGDPLSRRPGDYTLTRRLLGTPYSRWVECRVCDEYYVQVDSYHLRWSCPRCERHSKLYGYQWPKTDKEGKHDTEERVLDHRLVNRFVAPEVVKSIKRGKRTVPINLDGESQEQGRELSSAAKKDEKQTVAEKRNERGTKRPHIDVEDTDDEPSNLPRKRGRPSREEKLNARLAEQVAAPSKSQRSPKREVASKALNDLSFPRPNTATRHTIRRAPAAAGHARPELQAIRTKRKYTRRSKYAGRTTNHLSSKLKEQIEETKLYEDDAAPVGSNPRRTSLRIRRSTLKVSGDSEKILNPKFRRNAPTYQNNDQPQKDSEGKSSLFRPEIQSRAVLRGFDPSSGSKTHIELQEPLEGKTKYVRSGEYVGRYTPNTRGTNRYLPHHSDQEARRNDRHVYSSSVNEAQTRDPFDVPLEDVDTTSSKANDITLHGLFVEPGRKPGTRREPQPNEARSGRGQTSRTKMIQPGNEAASELTMLTPRTPLALKADYKARSAPVTRSRDNPNPRSVQELIKSANSRRFDFATDSSEKIKGDAAKNFEDGDTEDTPARSARNRSGARSVLELLASADRRRLDYVAQKPANEMMMSTVAGKLTTPSASKRLNAAKAAL